MAEILPIESADMIWILSNPDLPMIKAIAYKDSEKSKYYKTLPAWSLSALLELISPYIGEFSEGIDFVLGKAMNGKWYSAHYLQYTKEGVKPVKTVTGDTAVDAAFEIVVWLKENEKI